MGRHPSLPLRRALLACLLVAPALGVRADDRDARPRMGQMQPAASGSRPPSPRELVDAREVVARRFREPLATADSAAGATAAATALLDAAITEEDRAVKWLLLAEARRLAAAAGNAAVVDRSIVLTAAAFEFDAIAEEHRVLRGIPLQALDPTRAAGLATVAEGLAERAEADDRGAEAADAWALAIRGWQRAGDAAAARRAAVRLGQLERARMSATR